jgi:hypothetical protein
LLVLHSPCLSLPVNVPGLANTDYSVIVHDPLPRRVRREVNAYPFVRPIAEQLEPPPPPGPRRVRKFRSHEEEMRHRRKDLRNTLACSLALFEEKVSVCAAASQACRVGHFARCLGETGHIVSDRALRDS